MVGNACFLLLEDFVPPSVLYFLHLIRQINLLEEGRNTLIAMLKGKAIYNRSATAIIL